MTTAPPPDPSVTSPAAEPRPAASAIERRLEEVRGLAERGQVADPELLIDLLTDPEPLLRQAAAWSLGKLKESRGRAALERALTDPDPGVRARAAESLGVLADPASRAALETALLDVHSRVRSQAAWSLWSIGDARSLRPLAALLADPEPDVRWSAAVALGRLGDPAALEPLLAALQDPHDRVRREAVLALGHTRLPDIANLVRPFLTDPVPRVRIAAAVVLGQQKDRSSVPKLIERLRAESDPWVLPALLVALGRIGDTAATRAILPFARHRTSWARVCALHALGDLRAREAASIARERLDDDVWSVRGAAAECLGWVGSSDDLPRLLKLLEDSHMWPRRGAIYALGRLGLRAAAPLLRRQLGDPIAEIRLAAVWSLGHLGDLEARDSLIDQLARSDPSPAEGLTIAQGDGAVKLLSDAEARLFDSTVQALGRLRAIQADPAIDRAIASARQRLTDRDLDRPVRLPPPEMYTGTGRRVLRALFDAAEVRNAEAST